MVDILILPNDGGEWTTFPHGDGTLATITFKAIDQSQLPLSCNLTLNDTILSDDSLVVMPHYTADGTYQTEPLEFTYQPTPPSYGEVVFFESPEPLNFTTTYIWDFGDGTTQNTTDTAISHIFNRPGDLNTTLTLNIQELKMNITITKTITVGFQHLPLDVATVVGSPHFRGETVEFSILTKESGTPVNATTIKAMLYHNGTLYMDLSGLVERVDTGLYRIPYDIPADADTGTYVLVTKADYYGSEGADIANFLISPTLTGEILEIQNDIATISNGITSLRLNLTAINATITGLVQNNQGEVLAKIDTAVGTLTAKLDTINSTTLGDVKTKLDEIQSTATATMYAASILSAIAVIIALVILMKVRKK